MGVWFFHCIVNCQLFSKTVQRIQEAAKSSKAVLHFWWKRCQLNKTERPQLCMISITLPAETTHLTWPENTWTTFQYICHKKALCRFNTTRQINTARYQTPGYFKCAHIYQPGCVVCTLFAHTTLYTLPYIVLHCTQTDIWLYESFPVCDSEKNGDRGRRNSLFRADTRLWQERQAEIHWISDISRILLKSWQCSQNNSERWFETIKLEILFLWHSKKFATWKYMEDK